MSLLGHRNYLETGEFMGAIGIGRRLRLIMDIADEAALHAERFGFDFAIVAVDRGGRELLAYCSDLCSYNALAPARKKAITAAAMGMPTSSITAVTMADPIAQRALAASPDMLAVPGGFPIIQDGMVIGGIGMAGGHYTDDQQVLAKVLVKQGDPYPAMLMPPMMPPGGPQGGPPGGPPKGATPPIPGGMAPPMGEKR
jgi:glc operon protein GlcG